METKYTVKATAPKEEKRNDGNYCTITFDFAEYVETLEPYQARACISSWVISIQSLGRIMISKRDKEMNHVHTIGEVETAMLSFDPTVTRTRVSADPVSKVQKLLEKLTPEQRELVLAQS